MYANSYKSTACLLALCLGCMQFERCKIDPAPGETYEEGRKIDPKVLTNRVWYKQLERDAAALGTTAENRLEKAEELRMARLKEHDNTKEERTNPYRFLTEKSLLNLIEQVLGRRVERRLRKGP